MAAAYITASDVKSEEPLLDNLDIDYFVTKANKKIESVARTKEVFDPDDIETSPLDFRIEDYGITYAIEKALKAKAAENNNDLQVGVDRYWAKYQDIKGTYKELEKGLTKEVFTGDVTSGLQLYKVRHMERDS